MLGGGYLDASTGTGGGKNGYCEGGEVGGHTARLQYFRKKRQKGVDVDKLRYDHLPRVRYL